MAGRLALALVGALAGLCLWGLDELWISAFLPERLLLALTVFGMVFFGAVLAMTGPLRLSQATAGAAALGTAAALLISLAALRFDQAGEALDAGHPLAALLVLAVVPLPFWIAAQWRGWDDYPVLFGEAWAIAVRAAAAGLFLGLVWALIFLSDAMLALVDVSVIGQLVETAAAPWVVSGAILGLALAVMSELSDAIAPDIAIRFLRLLLPGVLAVVVVFVAALPLKGFSGFGGLSVGATLLSMTAVSVALISASVERNALAQARGPVMAGATRMLAALLPLPAGMAAYAIWLRVEDAGWSPLRVAAAAAAGTALTYGVVYFFAVLRGRGWSGRIRIANTWLAAGCILLAALWLTPLLNAEAIAARSQVARYLDGRTPTAELDLWSLSRWGRPGASAIARLEELAREPARADLAARLADQSSWSAVAAMPDTEVLRAELLRLLPVSPASATADRDSLIAALEPWEIDAALEACHAALPDGAPGCVLVAADFWPELEGNEAVLLSRAEGGWLRADGFVRKAGQWDRRGVVQRNGSAVHPDDVNGVIQRLQAAAPSLRPARMNELDSGAGAIVLLP